jgi:hypothetical protein
LLSAFNVFCRYNLARSRRCERRCSLYKEEATKLGETLNVYRPEIETVRAAWQHGTGVSSACSVRSVMDGMLTALGTGARYKYHVAPGVSSVMDGMLTALDTGALYKYQGDPVVRPVVKGVSSVMDGMLTALDTGALYKYQGDSGVPTGRERLSPEDVGRNTWWHTVGNAGQQVHSLPEDDTLGLGCAMTELIAYCQTHQSAAEFEGSHAFIFKEVAVLFHDTSLPVVFERSKSCPVCKIAVKIWKIFQRVLGAANIRGGAVQAESVDP